MLKKLREVQASPIFLIPIVLVIIGLCVYFLWLQPKMEGDQALKDFSTPEAQAKRDPDQRKVPADYAAKIQELRSKETHLDGSGSQINRRRERE